MKDVTYDPEEETQYECFKCGTITVAKSTPEACADCGTEMRNRRMPIE